MDIEELDQLYVDMGALKRALNNYWEIDRLSSGPHRDADTFKAVMIDIHYGMVSLPYDQRLVLFLNTALGYSAADISKIYDMPRSTVISLSAKGLDG